MAGTRPSRSNPSENHEHGKKRTNPPLAQRKTQNTREGEQDVTLCRNKYVENIRISANITLLISTNKTVHI